MSVCADERWEMELIVDNSTDVEHFVFDIHVDNEVISGRVIDSDGNETELSGKCSLVSPSGQPDVSFMNFRFLVRGQSGDVEILMGGIGFPNPDPALRPLFRGKFIAVAPIPPVVGPSNLLVVGIDEGDTGTGTGGQT